ncbi:hypothetical protein [Granulicella arctica]|uniref:Uncharacterized protein n=1 Tax=Granulicella arctica TaxID=940613 RepID=A0A7Y9PFZ1_9BACT|nr:hypothetical protein [Granulicella arctica]NYF79112.1 hypothetical protein [Granulicella arctica]
MKINVVKDKSGKTIATFESASGDGPKLVPVLPEGHKVEQLEVAANYQSNLGSIYA